MPPYEHVAMMSLDGERRPLAGATWAAATRKGSHLHHACACAMCMCHVHAHVHHVHAACDASHLLRRPDLGGCVVVPDGHVLFLPRVPHLVRVGAGVQGEGEGEGLGECWCECWCACTSVAMQPQLRPIHTPPCSCATLAAPCAVA